ncbi:DDE-type integrase/transposase/recombinase [uncultured Oscillibacter sp.]|uniref:DDE-type integrase/transposase/recombinase n=1 Tax=uncultured Oscillibacter sp. TaxID=876091 RepID=UPI003425804A
MTHFKVKSYWVYLCVIIDVYSRKIVGWRVSKNASTHLVTKTFRTADQERGRPGNLTFHSDRGSQYISKALTALFQKYAVKQFFSATARPLDNAVAESFFSTFIVKKHIAGSILPSNTSKRALKSIFGFTMKSYRIKR